jgi:hypothetical protein
VPIVNPLKFKLFGVPYAPRAEDRSFLDRAEVKRDDEFIVSVAVLDDRESERFFGVPMAHRGLQPVWLSIANHGVEPYRLRLANLDPNYYPPLEAAFVNHFRIGRRLVGFGVLALYFLPLLVLLPFKILGARSANRRMNTFFQEHGLKSGIIRPGDQRSGFIFSTHDAGTKLVSVKLQGSLGVKEFEFSIPVPGLKVDHGGRRFEQYRKANPAEDVDEMGLRKRLESLPRCTTNMRGSAEGDPLNLVVIGEFETILDGFGARWDETETISLGSCWRTLNAFLLGRRYRYSPVSPLYVAGRSQDVALQRARGTINERLHLRLWLSPLRFQGQSVWIGQISRDIGVRFTPKTWNLTTHKIDPDVDDARDYVLDDLMEAGRLTLVGYVAGAQAAAPTAPRRNLTGDPYFTDGLRAVAVFSETRTNPKFLNWSG